MNENSMTPRPKLRDIAIIIGSKSRAGHAAYKQLREHFGKEVGSIVETKRPTDLQRAIDLAKKHGAKVIAVGGGDGTMRLAAPAIIRNELTLAMIPTGTGNALARELGVPLNPVQAMEFVTKTAELRAIDIGRCNDHIFLTAATCGLTSQISARLEGINKGRLGRFSYLPAIIKAVRQSRPFQITVETPMGNFSGRVHQFVATASRTHAGPFRTTLDSENDDGLLSIYAVEATAGTSLLKYGLGLLRGKHVEQPNIWTIEAPSAVVRLNRLRPFVLDGDRYRVLTAHLKIEQHAIRVFAKPTD